MNYKRFVSRSYGFVAIKSLNSNYNADFDGQPRTLPDGTVYATDKALKYTIRHYIKNEYPDKKIFIYKRFNENQNPYTLAEAYEKFYNAKISSEDKKEIIKNLLTAIDIRLFGSTFAPKGGKGAEGKNISIHGPVQITHGINIWKEGNIYFEQISSPFRNPSEKNKKEKAQATLGRQSKLHEGHYIHHFSINPKNIEEISGIVLDDENPNENRYTLTEEDISLLKEALCKGATYYDSAAKAGTENEVLFYIELKKKSKLVLPNFIDLIEIKEDKGKKIFNLEKIKKEISNYTEEIEKVEIYYNRNKTIIENKPDNCEEYDLNLKKYDLN